MRGNPIEMIGKKFARLTCVGRADNDRHNHRVYRFQCACGNVILAVGVDVRGGHTKSCGCLQVEAVKRMATTHGLSKTKDYFLYRGVIARCEIPSASGYEYYGAQGISVCARWRDSFENFMQDMGHRPRGYSIERIDNKGNYEPENCRWATLAEQSRNKSNNVIIEHDGHKYILEDLAQQHGMRSRTLSKRLFKQGLSPEAAISKKFPNRIENPVFTYDGRTMHIKDWAKEYGMKEDTLRKRVNAYGLSFEEALLKPIRKYK